MSINKVVYGGKTLIDLTGDTVTADKLCLKTTFEKNYSVRNAMITYLSGLFRRCVLCL